MDTHSMDDTMTVALRSVLFELARSQDDLAAREAAEAPYWAPCPSSVIGHRAAAVALRAEANHLRAAD